MLEALHLDSADGAYGESERQAISMLLVPDSIWISIKSRNTAYQACTATGLQQPHQASCLKWAHVGTTDGMLTLWACFVFCSNSAAQCCMHRGLLLAHGSDHLARDRRSESGTKLSCLIMHDLLQETEL